MALDDSTQKLMDDIDLVTERLWNSPAIKMARGYIKDEMLNVDISEEERSRLLAAYVQQVSVGLISQAVSILTEAQAGLESVVKAKYDKLVSLAVLKKQYGYGDATEDDLGKSTNDGLIDKQTAGFEKDIWYKLLTGNLGVQQMLAQNDVPVPEWQVQIIKLLTEMITDGKINLTEVVNDAGEKHTEVRYDGESTEPDGLES